MDARRAARDRGRVAGRAELEASGSITLDTVRARGRDRGRLHLGRSAHALRARPRPLPDPGAPAMNLPMAPSPTARALTAEDIAALQAEVRALARSATPSSWPTTTRCPRSRMSPTTSATRWASAARRRAADADDDRLLRRALHGRDGVDPLPRQDRPDPRPRRRLLAGRLDHAPTQLRAWQAKHPRRRDRHVRQHDGRGQGADRLLRAPRRTRSRSSSTSCASTGRTRRSSSARTCSSAPTSRRRSGGALHVWDGECHVHAGHPPERHRRACAPSIRAPTS